MQSRAAKGERDLATLPPLLLKCPRLSTCLFFQLFSHEHLSANEGAPAPSRISGADTKLGGLCRHVRGSVTDYPPLISSSPYWVFRGTRGFCRLIARRFRVSMAAIANKLSEAHEAVWSLHD
jgi:hypothetical protein